MRLATCLLLLTWCLHEATSAEGPRNLGRKYSFSRRVQRVLAAKKNAGMQEAQNLQYLERVLPTLKTELGASELRELQSRASKPRLDFEPTGNVVVPLPQHRKNITMHIIGGSEASRTDYQHMGRMMIDRSFLCGCAVISSNYVLTAAHCTKGFNSFSITFGAEDLRLSLAQEEGRVVKTAASKLEHPNYNPDNLVNDIALVKLNSTLVLNNGYVAAIRLPRKSDAALTLEGLPVTISGYGLTKEGGEASQVLKQLSMSVIANSACVRFFGTYVTSNNVCCELKVDGERQSTCSGDSGGPLVRVEKADGVKTLVGVVSFGSAEGCTAGPSVFSRVAGYLGWISGETKIQIRP